MMMPVDASIQEIQGILQKTKPTPAEYLVFTDLVDALRRDEPVLQLLSKTCHNETLETLLFEQLANSEQEHLTRRWAGLLLLTLFQNHGRTTEAVKGIDDPVKHRLGSIVQDESQPGDLRLLAGAIIRHAVNNGLPLRSFWVTKPANTVIKAFPKDGSDSQAIVDLEEFINADLDKENSRPVVWATGAWSDNKDQFPPLEGRVLLDFQHGLTLITSDFNFIDISVVATKSVRRTSLVLQSTTVAVSDGDTVLEISFNDSPPSHTINVRPHSIPTLSLAFDSAEDCVQAERCVKECLLQVSQEAKPSIPLKKRLYVSESIAISTRATTPLQTHSEDNRPGRLPHPKALAPPSIKLRSRMSDENGIVRSHFKTPVRTMAPSKKTSAMSFPSPVVGKGSVKGPFPISRHANAKNDIFDLPRDFDGRSKKPAKKSQVKEDSKRAAKKDHLPQKTAASKCLEDRPRHKTDSKAQTSQAKILQDTSAEQSDALRRSTRISTTQVRLLEEVNSDDDFGTIDSVSSHAEYHASPEHQNGPMEANPKVSTTLFDDSILKKPKVVGFSDAGAKNQGIVSKKRFRSAASLSPLATKKRRIGTAHRDELDPNLHNSQSNNGATEENGNVRDGPFRAEMIDLTGNADDMELDMVSNDENNAHRDNNLAQFPIGLEAIEHSKQDLSGLNAFDDIQSKGGTLRFEGDKSSDRHTRPVNKISQHFKVQDHSDQHDQRNLPLVTDAQMTRDVALSRIRAICESNMRSPTRKKETSRHSKMIIPPPNHFTLLSPIKPAIENRIVEAVDDSHAAATIDFIKENQGHEEMAHRKEHVTKQQSTIDMELVNDLREKIQANPETALNDQHVRDETVQADITHESSKWDDGEETVVMDTNAVQVMQTDEMHEYSGLHKSDNMRTTSDAPNIASPQRQAKGGAAKQASQRPHQRLLEDAMRSITQNMFAGIATREKKIKDDVEQYLIRGMHLIDEARSKYLDTMDSADQELAKTQQSLTTILKCEEAKLARDCASVKSSMQMALGTSGKLGAAHAAQLGALDLLISSCG